MFCLSFSPPLRNVLFNFSRLTCSRAKASQAFFFFDDGRLRGCTRRHKGRGPWFFPKHFGWGSWKLWKIPKMDGPYRFICIFIMFYLWKIFKRIDPVLYLPSPPYRTLLTYDHWTSLSLPSGSSCLEASLFRPN